MRWPNRWGHASRSHRRMLDARDDESERASIERGLLDLYQGRLGEGEAFERLRELLGNRYDLLAYVFFLRDGDRFMPLAPKTFDEAFEILELDVRTSGRCSWQNYQAYNDALREVRAALEGRARVRARRLLDAHSFCWMLVRLGKKNPSKQRSEPAAKVGRKDPGRVLDRRESSILQMVKNAFAAAASSEAGPALKSPKLKSVGMDEMAFRKHVRGLLEKQENRCALTGIPLQWQGEQTDDELLASLDRIDSSGHYEPGNLQVVCRFINRWKSASDNDEFARLLELVRDSDHE